MEKINQREYIDTNHHNATNTTTKELDHRSPKKLSLGGGDRLKRDEWSEGAVSTLLEAYESKWVLRNRAKLKGHDWEDVARHVSSRSGCSKSPKTQTQCKNKIESMKKRYRSESTADTSSWPLYSRLNLLLHGNVPPVTQTKLQPPEVVPMTVNVTAMDDDSKNNIINNNNNNKSTNILVVEHAVVEAAPVVVSPPPLQPPGGRAPNSHGSNGVDGVAKEDGAAYKNILLSDSASDKKNNNNNSVEITSDTSSTPALYSEKAEKSRSRKTRNNKFMRMEKKTKMKRERKDKQESEIAKSIRWLADAVVKSEQARMEVMRDIERMRAEGEAKRAEMDLKRTEIIANTQLEIAKIFALAGKSKAVDSSLTIGRNP